jgi:hypothetical protein
MPFPRDGRINRLKAEADKAKSDLVEVRGALLRLLTVLNEKDEAQRMERLAEAELGRSRDHFRIAIADRILRGGGAFAISDDEQTDAYRHADQVQILPDPEAKTTRFSLLEGVALRELPKPPLAAVPPPAPADTPLDNGSAEGTDAASPEPGLGPHAVEDSEPSKDEPLPS